MKKFILLIGILIASLSICYSQQIVERNQTIDNYSKMISNECGGTILESYTNTMVDGIPMNAYSVVIKIDSTYTEHMVKDSVRKINRLIISMESIMDWERIETGPIMSGYLLKDLYIIAIAFDKDVHKIIITGINK